MTELHHPQLLESIEQIQPLLENRRLALFLDYDGTLTPIVRRPELATLTESLRATLRILATQMPVAIISGRDLEDVRQRVQLQGVVYAGSHGFEIRGPGELRFEHAGARQRLVRLDRAESVLQRATGELAGCWVERKRYAVAVHFREAEEKAAAEAKRQVDDLVEGDPGLRKRDGKKVCELQPAVDWHKGRAVDWLLRRLGVRGDRYLPIYIGDDLTDEDGFLAVEGLGVGILVSSSSRPSAATWRLPRAEAVEQLLGSIASRERQAMRG